MAGGNERERYYMERFEHYRARGEDWGRAAELANADTYAKFGQP